jgi:hypothetical protein
VFILGEVLVTAQSPLHWPWVSEPVRCLLHKNTVIIFVLREFFNYIHLRVCWHRDNLFSLYGICNEKQSEKKSCAL